MEKYREGKALIELELTSGVLRRPCDNN